MYSCVRSGIASLAELPPLHGDDYAEMEEAAGEAAYSGDEDADGAQAVCTERGCVMHTFLMVLLWVVLGLLALLAVLLIVPAAVAVEYKQGEFTARLKLLGIFSFRLYPMKEKADPEEKENAAAAGKCPEGAAG